VRALGAGSVVLGSGGAGCSMAAEGPPDGTVHVFNGTNGERRVTVTVERAGETLLDETYVVSASERATSERVLDAPGEYEVVATVGDSRSARTLAFPGNGEGRAKGYVRVAVERDGVLVSRAGL
jgi:hypothetical protein